MAALATADRHPARAAAPLVEDPDPDLSVAGSGGLALTADDVAGIVRNAAVTTPDATMSVVVVDRTGAILVLWHRAAATAREDELALSLARTGAFFGHTQAPLTSRTVRFISGIHFPPGTKNQAAAALYGIENTNRVDQQVEWNADQEYPAPLNVDGTGPSLGITTGKVDLLDSVPYPRAVNPGGMPLYLTVRTGPRAFTFDQVGGVGVAFSAASFTPAQAELSAAIASGTFSRFIPRAVLARVTAATGGSPGGLPYPNAGYPLLPILRKQRVYVDGIELPLVNEDFLRNLRPRAFTGPVPTPGEFRIAARSGGGAPVGLLAGPFESADLSAVDVTRIIQQSLDIASRTRAAIRLPIGSRAKFVIAVGDLNGRILGVYRMRDATIFSIDVAVAKARNVVYFSGPDRTPGDLPGLPIGTAVTNRSISFGAQPLFPPGINGTNPGPFFALFRFDSQNPGTQGADASANPKNGIVFFPGAVPLYRGGRLIGGLGISGDGVEQDDFVAFGGGRGFEPSASIRADQVKIRSVRIPYLKFPRNPTK